MSAMGDEPEADDIVFEYITDPVENVQDYVPGGLHPVHLGDTLNDGRYTILRKLGYGGYSTVWLAEDNSQSDVFVALKIARADTSHTKEFQIHNALQSEADQHPGSAYIAILQNHFNIAGPNGDHACLVYEVLGPAVGQTLNDYRNLTTIGYLTLPSIRKILHQVLLGLDYMHSIGVVQGDLYAANILLTIDQILQKPLENMFQS